MWRSKTIFKGNNICDFCCEVCEEDLFETDCNTPNSTNQLLLNDNKPILSENAVEFSGLHFVVNMILFVIMKKNNQRANLMKKIDFSLQIKINYKTGVKL